jgi:hypothetical protein
MSGDRIRAEFNARLDALLARADRLVAARQSELAHWEAKLADELARKRRPRMWSGTAQSSRPSSRCCRGGTVKIRQPERRGEAQAGFRTSHYEHCVPLRPLARMIADVATRVVALRVLTHRRHSRATKPFAEPR